MKALESRSQLLDAALASADEANRRWEECRALVDQLRVENTALRAALAQAQMAQAQGQQGQVMVAQNEDRHEDSENTEEQQKESRNEGGM